MALELPRPPIDEVVVSLVLDQPLGPDAVGSGRYLARRTDRFVRYEIHEPIASEPGFVVGPGPTRVWLISADDAWLVQLQEDRFVANWRRRGDAQYPGFTRSGGAMDYVVDEFSRFQAFCAEEHEGVAPDPVTFEMAKIDLLTQGRHWSDVADAARLLPVLSGAHQCMSSPDVNVAFRWQQAVEGGTLAVSIVPARMKADEKSFAYRLEFRFSGPVTGPLQEHLVLANSTLNDAFERLVPSTEHRRFV